MKTRKGLTSIELIFLLIVAFLVVTIAHSCGKPKKQESGKFVGLQTQALNEVVEVETETVSEPEPTTSFRILGHTIVDCTTATQEACGVNLKGCTNGKAYYCVQNLEAPQE
jgi:hypothetical protein